MNQQRDWGGYGAIIDEAQGIDREERNAPLVACPTCGTPLDQNARGYLNCRMGHGRWPPGIRRSQAGG